MNYKLRIKHPSGAEFEAEGPAEFILSEKAGFLRSVTGAPTAQQEELRKTGAEGPAWEKLIDSQKGLIRLKHKHPGLRAAEAALLILAAASLTELATEMAAITLSKAVKASGYAPGRLDRVLTKALREGLIKASGTKRNRYYSITDRGLEQAWLQAKRLL